ncbi:DNA-formamidopyrimidine glycosylase family protein [Candidatus Tokpelaia sp.]|uniref:DNA-formamidopyrimidine glycosylase family protein n=1 Tax=Candidatus Tokpelaia sp. TaxID=2233777 RepID=UPI00123B9375|nr:Fpg/Nei family DNA glycosylase [Candidatus Tokpelaia sp.]
MPELPEVETVRRGLAPVLEGAVIDKVELRRRGLRLPFPPDLAEDLCGREVLAVGRRAKYLLIDLSGGQTLISHLGMSGSWRVEEESRAGRAGLPAGSGAGAGADNAGNRPESVAPLAGSAGVNKAENRPGPAVLPAGGKEGGTEKANPAGPLPVPVLLKHDHVILHVRRPVIALSGRVPAAVLSHAGAIIAAAAPNSAAHAAGEQNFRLSYNDPRRFGFLLLVASAALATHPLLAGLGVEPLGKLLDGALLQQIFAGKKAPLKAVLLDQHNIAGLGNIYVCEALWRARLSPLRPAVSLAGSSKSAAKEAKDLAAAIRSVLAEALQSGGSHLRNYVKTDGSFGLFQHRFQVYGREGEPCRRCGAPIKRQVMSGRSSFYCAQCQK